MKLSPDDANLLIKELYEVNQVFKYCSKTDNYIIIGLSLIAIYKDISLIKGKINSSNESIYENLSTEINGTDFYKFYSDNKKCIQEVHINDNGTLTIISTNEIYNTTIISSKEPIKKYNSLLREIKSNKCLDIINKFDYEILEMKKQKNPISIITEKVNFRFPPAFIFCKPTNPVKVFSLLDFQTTKKHKNISKYLQDVNIESIEMDKEYDTDLVHVSLSKDPGLVITSKVQTQKMRIYESSISNVCIVKWSQLSKFVNIDLIFKIHNS